MSTYDELTVAIRAFLDGVDADMGTLRNANASLADALEKANARIRELETPPTPPALMGASVGRKPTVSGIAADEALLGPTQVGRIFFGNQPLVWGNMGALQNLASIISVKFYERNLTRAQIRTEVFRFLDAAPVNDLPKFVMDDHEKDAKVAKGTYSLATGIDDTNYMNSLVKEHGHPDFRTTLLLTGFSANVRFPQWTNVNQDILDTFAFDFYRGREAKVTLDLAAEYFPGKPLVIGEVGAGIVGGERGTDAVRSGWLGREARILAADPRVQAMCYFQLSNHAILDTEPLTRQAWADVRAAATSR